MSTEILSQDLRYAVRALRKAPAYSIATIITLAIGVGASTAIFSMANGVLLRAMPAGVLSRPQAMSAGPRLVHLRQPSASSDNEGFSVLEVKDLNQSLKTAAGVVEYH